MEYSIAPSDDGKYIILKVVGEFGRQQALAWHLEAHKMGAEMGIDRFLLDFYKGRNTDTVMRNYTFVSQDMRTPGINLAARIAMLVSPYDHSHDFIEAMLKQEGVDVCLFYDLEPAIAFLNKP
jgi:hypothetical protein